MQKVMSKKKSIQHRRDIKALVAVYVANFLKNKHLPSK